MSQPYELDKQDSGFTSAPPGTGKSGIPFGAISSKDADAKRAEFEAKIFDYFQEIEQEYFKELETLLRHATPDATPDETPGLIERLDPSIIKFYYFIGRCNPPHPGHIEALTQLCQLAKNSGIPALILLGSGPQGERMSFSNPLDFATKSAFIRKKLSEAGFEEGVDFVIKEMKSPYIDVPNYVATGFGKIINDGQEVEKIEVAQLAGDKGDDTTKLKGVLDAVGTKIKPLLQGAEFSGIISPVHAAVSGGVAMSATEVRKTALDSYASAGFDLSKGYQKWPEKFQRYYGIDMYEAIVRPATKLIADRRENASVKKDIDIYVSQEILPKSVNVTAKNNSGLCIHGRKKENCKECNPSGVKSKGKGGSKRKLNKSQKRKPNKTQKRRKRRTRRRR